MLIHCLWCISCQVALPLIKRQYVWFSGYIWKSLQWIILICLPFTNPLSVALQFSAEKKVYLIIQVTRTNILMHCGCNVLTMCGWWALNCPVRTIVWGANHSTALRCADSSRWDHTLPPAGPLNWPVVSLTSCKPRWRHAKLMSVWILSRKFQSAYLGDFPISCLFIENREL